MKDSEGKIQSVKEINSGYFVVNRKTFVLHDTAQNGKFYLRQSWRMKRS
jgi:hypothetical protein